ncbi:MAG TPA: hypothetical protein VHZ56_08495 [Devosia sp.]|jgi:hypothetical protein|nr:hypothetical protein [Devosia sp.]
MAHIDLGHADMKPAPIVRYEIAQDLSRTKQMMVGAVIAATMIVVMAAMFLTTVH